MRTGCDCTVHFGESRCLEAVAVASPHVTFLHALRSQSYGDAPPALVGVRLRIVAKRIEMSQIIPDRCKSSLFVCPALGEVSLTSRGRSHALKYSCRDWLQLRLLSA